MSLVKTIISHKKAFAVFIISFIFYLLLVFLAFFFFIWEQLSPNEYLGVDEELSGFGIFGNLLWWAYGVGIIATFLLLRLVEWFLNVTGNYYVNLEDYGLYNCGGSWISLCFPSFFGIVLALTVYLIVIFLLNYLIFKRFFSNS